MTLRVGEARSPSSSSLHAYGVASSHSRVLIAPTPAATVSPPGPLREGNAITNRGGSGLVLTGVADPAAVFAFLITILDRVEAGRLLTLPLVANLARAVVRA